MNILAFSDTHLNKKAIRNIHKLAKKADILICAGDLSWFGQGLDKVLKDLNKIKKPLYIIPGNHEEPPTELRRLCKPLKNIEYVHKKTKKIHGYKFFFWGEGGFAQTNKAFEKAMHAFKKTLKKGDEVVLVTHGPPYKTKLDYLPWAGHVGCKSQKKFLREIKPILHIFGHLHEHVGETQTYNKTALVNPGPAGTIIEL